MRLEPQMRIQRIAAAATVVMSSFLSGGCESPVEPTPVFASIDSVSVVESSLPGIGKVILVSVRVAAADGSSIELWNCSVNIKRYDGQRWDSVDGQFCSAILRDGPDVSPVVDGVLSWSFRAPNVPGQYRFVAAVRRSGRMENIPVQAGFAISAAQARE